MYRNNDPMKAYMQEIGIIPLINKDEEIELAHRIKKGDYAAKQKLIKANLRLVVKIAHDFKGLGLPLLDLISEGNIGLMRAAEKFDPAKGAKFSSYSAWWIKQAMRRALSQKSRTIRVPVASASKISKIRAAKVKLGEKFGRLPTDVEIASHLDFTKRTIQGLRLADLKTFSMHDPIQKGEDGNFEDIIPDSTAMKPDDIIEDSETLQRVRGLIQTLDERERTILIMRYGLDGSRPKTLEEVSVIIGRTRERVRQIQMQSLKKLKVSIEDETFDNNGEKRECMPPKNSIKIPKNMIAKGVHFQSRSKRRNADLEFQSIPIGQHVWGYGSEEDYGKLLNSRDLPIENLKISRRSINGLHSIQIKKVSQLATKSPNELMDIHYFGIKCLNEVQDAFSGFAQLCF